LCRDTEGSIDYENAKKAMRTRRMQIFFNSKLETQFNQNVANCEL
jgi:hypothetical protein